MNSTVVAPGPLPRIDRSTYRADSRHYHVGRLGRPIKKIVLHNTEGGSRGNAPSGVYLSTFPGSGVSIHHLYGRDGTRYDIVDRADAAYHCGDSACAGYSGSAGGIAVLNLISLGHELESSSTASNAGDGYTPAQYDAASYTLACELVSYGLTWTDVVDHKTIALPPGRRNDPSNFDRALLEAKTAAWVAFLRALPADQLPEWCI